MHWASAAVTGAALANLDQASSALVAYDPGHHGADSWEVVATLVASALVARMVARRGLAGPSLPTWLIAASVVALTGGALLHVTFPTPVGPLAARVVPVANVLSTAALGGAAWPALLRPALALGAVSYFMSPLRLIGAPLLLGAWLAASASVAPLQRAGLASALLGIAAFVTSWPLAHLHGRIAPPSRWRASTAAACALAAMGFVQISVRGTPSGEVASYPETIVYATGSEPRWVVTGGPAGFELFSDRQLVASTLDGHRHADALVGPALALSTSPERALVLGPTTGMVEARLLHDGRPTRIVSVTPDETSAMLSRSMPWLRRANADALSDPRVRVVVDEPVPWLAEHEGRYDLVVLSMGAPIDYLVGKAYTTYTFERLRAALSPGGIAVIPAASAVETPEAHSSIVGAARAAGLHVRTYHIGFLTRGEWSIVLASRSELDIPEPIALASDFMTPASFRGALLATPDRHTGAGPTATLHEQVAVTAFRAEQRR